ncbi:chromosome segregation protein SMC [Pseudomonas sp. P105]|uniref:chromosome segregation protein SMC n=1 Tax=Pseudomonas sp. P105 TaxID=3049542 RepID=UPI00293454AE|nr:chromosome segregation protein SMC [Pseudomonas sp. P105]WNZ79321.1 chromosome segregation protein SMC [Pseudomonas sp. P105]
MTVFQANTEQCELLTDERESREVTDLAQPISDGTEATGHCEKKQLLLDEIEKLKISRDKYLSEAEQLYTEMAPLEALLEGDVVMDAHRQYEVQKQYNDLKRPYDSRNHHASIITSQITRRENLANHETLMAGYTEAMANWKADEQELNEKRNSLSSRLEQIRRQANEDMASAREAETDAATAYAQAVAWGDTEGEINASADAQKAAKNLATAIEHNRRQHLIMSALEQELVTVDKYIVEAQKEHKAIERHALLLAHTVLEEQWNTKAEELLDMGGKLWASYRLIDRDQVVLRKLVLPFEGEKFGHWNSNDLVERSYKHTVQDVLSS